MSGGPLLLAVTIRQLHAIRVYEYGLTVCGECRQVWPCATELAVRTWEAIPEASASIWTEAATVTEATGTDAPQRWMGCSLRDAHGPHEWRNNGYTWKCAGRPGG